jgi:hypothetical protein
MHCILSCILCLLLISISSSSFEWAPLYPEYPLPEEGGITLNQFLSNGGSQYLQWGCIFNANNPHHGYNKWHELEMKGTPNKTRELALEDNCFVRGNTIWVNEHQSVGHAMYDIMDMQILDLVDVKIDRFVLQRAPCMNWDLCRGVGTFDGWFKGFYMAMIHAFRPGIPLFVRFKWQQRELNPMYLDPYAPDGEAPKPKTHENGFQLNSCYESQFILSPVKCGRGFFTRNSNRGFWNSISAATVKKFKEAAYNLTVEQYPERVALWRKEGRDMGTVPPLHFTKDAPIVVTLARRAEPVARRFHNITQLRTILKKFLPKPQFHFREYISSNDSRGYAEQIRIAAESQVIIAEHGGFASNMIYMRNASLWIELRGTYTSAETINFERLARLFGLYMHPITISNLEWHKQTTFTLTQSECLKILQLILRYAQDKPYAHNIKE